MRLSEAILLGSTQVRPTRGVVLQSSPFCFDELGGCALGMAVVAAGIHWRMTNTLTFCDLLRKQFPILETLVAALPCGCQCSSGGIGYPLENVIVHLFDCHFFAASSDRSPWTLDQLVEFVASVEDSARKTQEPKPDPAKAPTKPTPVHVPPRTGCEYDNDGDGNCHFHPQGCPLPAEAAVEYFVNEDELHPLLR